MLILELYEPMHMIEGADGLYYCNIQDCSRLKGFPNPSKFRYYQARLTQPPLSCLNVSNLNGVLQVTRQVSL